MTQGELEKIPLSLQKAMSELEIRIMTDIVRRIKANGFSPASADWQITRLRQLGESEKDIKKWIQDALQVSDAEIDRIFSDEVYEEYYGHERAYRINGMEQIPFEQNWELQQTIEAARMQTHETFRNMTGSMGFAIRDPATGKLAYSPLRDFYQSTLDAAMLDIHSGAFDSQTVLTRTINQMTNSGLRWIDYDSGWHNRVDVAARRAVMTGFRQVQGKINEQVAEQLGTDQYETTAHVGARPTHQPWQGRVWTMQELIDVCGLGEVTGLHGANCYHDYKAFPPGSIRTYTDEQLEEMMERENTLKEYNGKQYTTYEALQQQRKMETVMRKTRQDIKLLQEGGASDQEIMLKKAKYQGQMQTYKDFSKKIGLPEQVNRVYQDGLGGIGKGKIPEVYTSRVPKARKEVAGSIFNVQPLMKGDTVSAINIYKNLNKTEIGKGVIDYIRKNNTTVDVFYNKDSLEELDMYGEYGKAIGNHIYINGLSTNTLKKIAKTIIHEEKHIELDIGGDQHAEAVCDYYGELHEKGQLTGEDIRNIIKSVKQRYPEYKWRRR